MSERRDAGMEGFLFSPFKGGNGPLKILNAADQIATLTFFSVI
jgi:hypothetical protein